jgi:hypothetical protein
VLCREPDNFSCSALFARGKHRASSEKDSAPADVTTGAPYVG